MIEVIREAWSWVVLDPAEVIATNAFGNYIVRATDATYWRICPEEVSCEKVAANESEYETLLQDEEFIADWELQQLLEVAVAKFGSPTSERCFCLKIPGVFGGKCLIDNVGTISRRELVSFAGDMAQQIKDVPEGARLKLKIIGGS
jgi:hypothetical protein